MAGEEKKGVEVIIAVNFCIDPSALRCVEIECSCD